MGRIRKKRTVGYVLRDRQTGERYVGITSRYPMRMWEHRAKGKMRGRDFEIEKIVDFSNMTDARVWEKIEIDLWGVDNLLNTSLGGYGGFGRKWTPEMRAAASKRKTDQQADPDFRRRMSESCKKAWASPHMRKKQSERAKSSINFEARSAAQKKAWADPDIRQKRADGIRKQAATPEGMTKRSSAAYARWAKQKEPP